MDLATKQVDYTAAFVHAPFDLPPNLNQMSEIEKQQAGAYIEMPRGFMQQDKALKLKSLIWTYAGS